MHLKWIKLYPFKPLYKPNSAMDAFIPSLDEISSVVLEKKVVKGVYNFSCNKITYPLLVQWVWLVLSHWYWRKGRKCEKFTNKHTNPTWGSWASADICCNRGNHLKNWLMVTAHTSPTVTLSQVLDQPTRVN